MMNGNAQRVPNTRNSDRIFVLEPMDGKKTLSSKGMVDTRLFSGDNTLHGVMDKETSLWSFKYDSGVLPSPLKSKFTTFRKMMEFAEEYMKQRNIKIKEVID